MRSRKSRFHNSRLLVLIPAPYFRRHRSQPTVKAFCRRRERGCDGCDRWRSVRVGHSGFDGRRNRFCRRRNLRRALELEDLGAMADRCGGGAGRAREGMNASLGAPAHRTTLLEDR